VLPNYGMTVYTEKPTYGVRLKNKKKKTTRVDRHGFYIHMMPFYGMAVYSQEGRSRHEH